MITALKELFELGKEKAKKSPKGVDVRYIKSIESFYYNNLILNFIRNLNDEHIEEFSITEMELKNIEQEFRALFTKAQESLADIEHDNYMNSMRYESFRNTLNNISKGAYNYLSEMEAKFNTKDCEKKIKEFRNEIAKLGSEYSVKLSGESGTEIEVRDEVAYIAGSDKPFTGKLEIFHLNGQKQKEADYKDGKENGLTTSWDESGKKILVANYKDGKQDGLTTSWNYENGQKKETDYKHGERNGLHTTWNKKGYKEAEINYKDGLQDGLFSVWDENGKQLLEANYKNGEPVGKAFWGERNGLHTTLYPNGQKESEVNYKDGKKDGLHTYWYENGKKKKEINYKDGEKDNLIISWDETGLKNETIYKDGKGVTTTWYENGQKESEVNFKDGEPNGKATYWYENGQKRSEDMGITQEFND